MKAELFPRIVASQDALKRIVPPLDDEDLIETVRGIIRAVRRDGDRALKLLTEKYDKVRIREIWVRPRSPRLPAGLRSAMETAYERIIRYHAEFTPRTRVIPNEDGVAWGQIVRPIRRVGIYVPGGTAPLFSTLLMAAGAARAAGVEDLLVTSPPPINGAIFAAAEIAGIGEIYQVGGAQAIAALAVGTESIRPVDKIVGPGNRFVTEAKRQVYGHVGIDSLAGPTEIVVIADESANAGESANVAVIAADLLAQAEHAIDARSILVTTSPRLAKRVQAEVASRMRTLPRSELASVSLRNRGAIVVCVSMDEAISVVNAIAPEHLSIQTEAPMAVAERITAAGAIFLGAHSSEALGDYIGGPNHVLPTFGTARFSGPLSASDFQCVSSVQEFSPEAARRLGKQAAIMARAEGLEGHARSLEARATLPTARKTAKRGLKVGRGKKR